MESAGPSPFVILGRIGAPFGIGGFVHVQSFAQEPSDLLNYNPWNLKIKGVWHPYEVLEAREHGNGLVAKLAGSKDREAAQSFTNAEIGIERDRLPTLSEGEYYWFDLLGLQVINEEGLQLGTVVKLLETGANDVLVVEGTDLENGEKREYLIPYVPKEYVVQVDLEAQQMIVHWGLDY